MAELLISKLERTREIKFKSKFLKCHEFPLHNYMFQGQDSPLGPDHWVRHGVEMRVEGIAP